MMIKLWKGIFRQTFVIKLQISRQLYLSHKKLRAFSSTTNYRKFTSETHKIKPKLYRADLKKILIAMRTVLPRNRSGRTHPESDDSFEKVENARGKRES